MEKHCSHSAETGQQDSCAQSATPQGAAQGATQGAPFSTRIRVLCGVILPEIVWNQVRRLGMPIFSYTQYWAQQIRLHSLVDCRVADDPENPLNLEDMLTLTPSESLQRAISSLPQLFDAGFAPHAVYQAAPVQLGALRPSASQIDTFRNAHGSFRSVQLWQWLLPAICGLMAHRQWW